MDFKDQLVQLNTAFNYDWNNHTTFEAVKEHLPAVEKFIAANQASFTSQTGDDAKFLGQLLYKYATYQLHSLRAINAETLKWLKLAETILVKHNQSLNQEQQKQHQKEIDWVRLQIAFYYQQKMARATVETQDEMLAFNSLVKDAVSVYPDIVNSEIQDPSDEEKDIQGFAYAISALVKYEAARKIPVEYKVLDELSAECRAPNIEDAIKDYEHSAAIYESKKTFDPFDFQYLRVLNRLAMMYAEAGHEKKALDTWDKVANLWLQHRHKPNPYISRYHDARGDYYVDGGYPDEAVKHYQMGLAEQKKFDDSINSNDIKKLAAKLDATLLSAKWIRLINKDWIHTEAKNNQNEFLKIKTIFDEFHKNPFFPPKLLAILSGILALYYTFYVRDVDLAPYYTNLCLTFLPNHSPAYLEMKVFAAFSSTLDVGNSDLRPFLEAKEVIEEFRRQNLAKREFLENTLTTEVGMSVLQEDAELLDIASAFNDRNIALMHYRSAPLKPKVEDNTLDSIKAAESKMFEAYVKILNVLKNQEVFFLKQKELELDVAESRQILSDILSKQAQIASVKSKLLAIEQDKVFSEGKLNQANEYRKQKDAELVKAAEYATKSEAALTVAISHWKSFNLYTNAHHPIANIANLRHARLLESKGQYLEAENIYASTILKQMEGNAGDEVSADLSETYHHYAVTVAAHCMSEIKKGNHDFGLALETRASLLFEQSISIKCSLLERSTKKDPSILNQILDAFEEFKQNMLVVRATATAVVLPKTIPATQAPKEQGIFGSPKTTRAPQPIDIPHQSPLSPGVGKRS